METVRNEGAKKNYFVPLIIVLVLIILVLLFLISPLRDLVFPPDTEPTLALAVVEKIGPDPATGLYRVVVEAEVDGKPEPQISFNRNDGVGEVKDNHTLLLLEEEETFLLKALASNPRGTAEAELELFGGIMVGASTGQTGPAGSPGSGGSSIPGPGAGGDDDDEETPPPAGNGGSGDPGPGDGGDDGEDEPDAANRPPAINDITKSSEIVLINNNITITAQASDPDGDPLTYAWSCDEGTIVSNANINPISWTAPDTAGTYRVSLTVRDGRGGETVGSIDIAVVRLALPLPRADFQFAVLQPSSKGMVDSDGRIWSPNNVGDNSENQGVQGFITFDLSSIPRTATISSARLETVSYDILGDPFRKLGSLRVYVHNYGTLDSSDYVRHSPAGAIIRFSRESDLNDASKQELSEGGISGIQAALAGSQKFQIRLQFNERESFSDDIADMVRAQFRLRVTYTN